MNVADWDITAPWEYTPANAPGWVSWGDTPALTDTSLTLPHGFETFTPTERRRLIWELVAVRLGPVPESQVTAQSQSLGDAPLQTLGPGQDPTAQQVYVEAQMGQPIPLDQIAALNFAANEANIPQVPIRQTPLVWDPPRWETDAPMPWTARLSTMATIVPSTSSELPGAIEALQTAHAALGRFNPLTGLVPVTSTTPVSSSPTKTGSPAWAAQSVLFDTVLSYGVLFNRVATLVNQTITVPGVVAAGTLAAAASHDFGDLSSERILKIRSLLYGAAYSVGDHDGTTIANTGNGSIVTFPDGATHELAVEAPNPDTTFVRRYEALLFTRAVVVDSPYPGWGTVADTVGTWMQRMWGVPHPNPVGAAEIAYEKNTAAPLQAAVAAAGWGLL